MGTLQILYLVMAALGGALLLLSIFGGDADGIDLDVGDADFDISDAEVGVDAPGVFSMKTLSTFILGFGIAGIIVTYQGGGPWAQIIWGFLTGLVISALYFLAMKFMYSQQGSSLKDARTFIGKEAIVSIPTTDSGKGQVKIEMTEYSCVEKNNKQLKQNEVVKVISVIGPGTLLVESK